jgi:hypothetical protein
MGSFVTSAQQIKTSYFSETLASAYKTTKKKNIKIITTAVKT